MSLRLLVRVAVFILLVSCQSQESLPKFTGKEYVPLIEGTYWEYAVTTTTISPVGGQTNELTEVRVEVAEVKSENGETTCVLHRYVRPQGTATYVSEETWSVETDEFKYIQQEGNVPYVRIQFPVAEGKTWNGNAFNTQGGTDDCGDGNFTCDMFAASQVGKPFELPGVSTYDDTLTIVESDEEDPIIGKDLRKAIYARNVGLVYREEIHLEYCTVGSCIGQQQVENGTIVRQTLLTYGAP